LESLPLPLLVCIFFFSFFFSGSLPPSSHRSVFSKLPVLIYPVYTVGNTHKRVRGRENLPGRVYLVPWY
jgi:hypothetical protein